MVAATKSTSISLRRFLKDQPMDQPMMLPQLAAVKTCPPAGAVYVKIYIYIYKFAIRSFCCNGTSFTRCGIQIDVALSHRKSEKEPAQNQIILRNTREFSSGIQWEGIQQSWGGPLKWLHHARSRKTFKPQVCHSVILLQWNKLHKVRHPN